MNKLEAMSKIKEYKIGTVVKHKHNDEYGHIMGFGRNSTNELVLMVQWEFKIGTITENFKHYMDKMIFGVHPEKIIIIE